MRLCYIYMNDAFIGLNVTDTMHQNRYPGGMLYDFFLKLIRKLGFKDEKEFLKHFPDHSEDEDVRRLGSQIIYAGNPEQKYKMVIVFKVVDAPDVYSTTDVLDKFFHEMIVEKGDICLFLTKPTHLAVLCDPHFSYINPAIDDSRVWFCEDYAGGISEKG